MPSNVEAIFGFAREQNMKLAPNRTPKDHDYYLTALAGSEEPTFSTRFQRDFISWIDIGTPDLSNNKTEMLGWDLERDYFWSVPNSGIRIGEKKEDAWAYPEEGDSTWMNNGVYTILDTGASDIFLSVLWFDSFIQQFYSRVGIEFEVREGTAWATCSAEYPSVYFLLNGYWLEVPSDDYLVEDGNECRLRIRPIDAGFNILGMPAYIGYYVAHTWASPTGGASL